MLDGVIVRELRLLPNSKGRLMEVQRCDDEIFPGFGQLYVTSSFPGIVKAWYLHRRQIDQIAVVRGLLKLVLYDVRPSSATRGQTLEIILGELAPKLVQIPPGIWHGFQAIGTDEVFLLHLNSLAYDFEDPDEERLSSDDASIPYTW